MPLLQGTQQGAAGGADPAEQPAQLAPGAVGITWRGDGRYFATASLDAPGAGSATLRIWERETAELHAVGQAESTTAALLLAAAWQPNGRHLFVAASLGAQQAQQEEQQGEQPALRSQQPAAGEEEQARLAAAEGIAHVGAWKRELRRRQQRRAEGGGGDAAALGSEAGVLLFERNGLQHGGFELPPSLGGAIEQLAWSPDSEFLAVLLSEADDSGEAGRGRRSTRAACGGLVCPWGACTAAPASLAHRLAAHLCRPCAPSTSPPSQSQLRPPEPRRAGLPQQVLQLWHRSNWHWYLKAERRSPLCSGLRCAWDAGGGLLLHLVTAEGDYQQVGVWRGRRVCGGDGRSRGETGRACIIKGVTPVVQLPRQAPQASCLGPLHPHFLCPPPCTNPAAAVCAPAHRERAGHCGGRGWRVPAAHAPAPHGCAWPLLPLPLLQRMPAGLMQTIPLPDACCHLDTRCQSSAL